VTGRSEGGKYPASLRQSDWTKERKKKGGFFDPQGLKKRKKGGAGKKTITGTEKKCGSGDPPTMFFYKEEGRSGDQGHRKHGKRVVATMGRGTAYVRVTGGEDGRTVTSTDGDNRLEQNNWRERILSNQGSIHNFVLT